MARLTIRNLDDDLIRKLRDRAAGNGRSMSEEVRQILVRALPAPPLSLAESIRARVDRFGGFDLDIQPREPLPEPPNFD